MRVGLIIEWHCKIGHVASGFQCHKQFVTFVSLNCVGGVKEIWYRVTLFWSKSLSRIPTSAPRARGRRGREHQITTSPSDTESQSLVLNLATDVAEQLSATLQACLRNCVRQHALPSSHRHSQHSPPHSSATSGPHWLGNLATGPNVSLPSPLCAVSPPRT